MCSMTKDHLPIRLREARLMMKFSMEKLAARTGGAITKQSISRYEKGIMHPKHDALQALAQALNISKNYFKGTNLHIDVPRLRTTSNNRLADEELISLEAKLSFWAEQYLAKEREANFHTSFKNPIQDTAVLTIEDAIRAADLLRERWHCGDGSIPSILRLMERKGIKILSAELPKDVLGLSTWVDETHPLIILDMRPEQTTVERIRYTAAHELAHLLLTFPDGLEFSIEKRCDLFAGFFLMPKSAFVEEMGAEHRNIVTLEEMIDIKNIYGISIHSLIITARYYGIITTEYKRWWYDKYPQQNPLEKGWGHYPYPETLGREKRIEAIIMANKDDVPDTVKKWNHNKYTI